MKIEDFNQIPTGARVVLSQYDFCILFDANIEDEVLVTKKDGTVVVVHADPSEDNETIIGVGIVCSAGMVIGVLGDDGYLGFTSKWIYEDKTK